ncbi:hypothetical protein EJD97_014034 [Solanum chilense]|uniref:Uncharacterized protein n=1 Tax=Solanum chilense TaxID=4083 RepID=A0A6N2B9P9_SOLCI|nr:hypothetical protein EJD97_014034 [Solanum chilense]
MAKTNGFMGHDMLAPFTAAWMIEMGPLVIDKAEGSYVYDVNGKKYLDSLSGLWCTVLGGSEPRLIEAANKQLNKLAFYHSFWNRTTKPSLDLATELINMFTANKMGKVFFTNSGSEANDTQVKLVWYYNNAIGRPNKKKIISRKNAYHGSTYMTAGLSGLPSLHLKFDLPPPYILHTDCPHYWNYHLPGETEEEYSTRLANNLENLILKEGPETVAAFIAEPVMGGAGVIIPPATYFEKIQAVLKKYDILFIADEVICGFGRLGTMFGCDKYNIKPDLVSIAKALSGGYIPIGAVLVSEEISKVIMSQSNQKIRGTGLVLSTEFVDNKSPNDPFPPEWGVGTYFGSQCQKHGMLVSFSGDHVNMAPPFTLSLEELDEMISIYGKALKDTEKRVEELKSQKK